MPTIRVTPDQAAAIEAMARERGGNVGGDTIVRDIPRSLRVEIPIKLASLANVRMHWRALQRLKTAQKVATRVCFANKALPPLPVRVTITRIGKKTLDSDNLTASAKYVRDTIADLYGVDDGSGQYEWVVRQEKGKAYCVVVEIERYGEDFK